MSEISLPEGWCHTTLGGVIELKYGKSLPARLRDGGEFPVYGSNGVVGGHSEPLIKSSGLIVGRKGSYGEVQISEQPFFPIDTTYFVDELGQQPLKYWYYQLKYLPLTELNRSTAIPGLNREDAYAQEIYFPPLAEQKVIADKLDSILAQVETTKARLEHIPEILKTFRQSVLASAVSGKLTEEWRLENVSDETASHLLDRWLSERKQQFNLDQERDIASGKIKRPKKFKEPSSPDLETSGPITIPSDWTCVSVSEFAECLDSQRIPVKKEDRESTSGIYPYLGANGEVDRVDNYIFDDDLVLVTEDETFYGRVKPIAYRYSGKCWVNNHVHVLRAMSKDANDYLCYALMYYKVIPWLSGTTGRAKLTQAALNVLPIGLPPSKEISEIVQRVEQLFAFADSVEEKANAARERVNKLTQSILAKAFRGELTADWRAEHPDLISGENSAEALLERIKAERAALSQSKTKKKPAKKKIKKGA